jgi:DNA polymerase elongation subunit (family B)
MNTNHIGSFVYVSSLITAVGRSMINKLINIGIGVENNGTINGRVFYCDTDSIMLDVHAFKNVVKASNARLLDIDNI